MHGESKQLLFLETTPYHTSAYRIFLNFQIQFKKKKLAVGMDFHVQITVYTLIPLDVVISGIIKRNHLCHFLRLFWAI